MITQEYLHENIRYEPDTGLVYWTKSKKGRDLNKPIGTIDHRGYSRTLIDGKYYLVSRIIWLYLYGYIPNKLDHINHIRTDDRLTNLREVSSQENKKNGTKYYTNKSGIVGVHEDTKTKKWIAQISNINSKRINLGRYKDFIEAVYTRWIAENIYQYHSNHGR